MKKIIGFLVFVAVFTACDNHTEDYKPYRRHNVHQKDTLKNVESPETQILELVSKSDFFDGTKSENKDTIYSYNLSGEHKLYLVFSSNPEYGCHACGVYMSIFVFAVDTLLYDFIGVDELGSWGQPPYKDDIEIFELDTNFLVTIRTGFMGQGVLEENLLCYYVTKNQAKLIGNFEVAFDDSAAMLESVTSWESDYYLKRTNDNTLPDFQIIRQGFRNDSDFVDTVLYFFNGKNYEQATK